MDNISILFKEYDTLRTEIISRTNNGYQVITVGGIVGAATVSWLGSHRLDPVVLSSAGFVAAILCVFGLIMFRDTNCIAYRLRELEAQIN